MEIVIQCCVCDSLSLLQRTRYSNIWLQTVIKLHYQGASYTKQNVSVCVCARVRVKVEVCVCALAEAQTPLLEGLRVDHGSEDGQMLIDISAMLYPRKQHAHP